MYRVPVDVGEELDVTIEAVGEKGDGIAKKDGFILFVPGVKQGQRVRIKVTKVLKKVGFAELVPGGAQTVASSDEAQQQAPADEPEPMPEAAPEDSEDFGDESAEEQSTDVVEEPAE